MPLLTSIAGSALSPYGFNRAVASGGPLTLTFLNNYATETDPDTSSKTFTSVDFGTPASDRYIIAAVGARNDSGTFSSITIGGVTATIVVQHLDGNTASGIAIAAVPTGTSGNVVINLSGSHESYYLGVWSVTGLSSPTAVATDTSTGDGSYNLSHTLLTASGGFTIFSSCTGGGGNGADQAASCTSGNATVRYDGFSTTPAHSRGAAMGADSTLNDGTSTTFNFTQNDNNSNDASCAASFL